MMKSTFWFGIDVGEFLFPGFNVTSTKGLAATCVAVFSVSLISEGCKALLLATHRASIWTAENLSTQTRGISRQTERNWLLQRIYETLGYILHIITAYLLMLSVMSYNGAIFLSIIFGSTTGYAIFRTCDTPSTVTLSTIVEQEPVFTRREGQHQDFDEASTSTVGTNTVLVHNHQDL